HVSPGEHRQIHLRCRPRLRERDGRCGMNNADDREPEWCAVDTVWREADSFAQRVLAAKCRSHQRLIDDRYRRVAVDVRLRDATTDDERHAQRLEERRGHWPRRDDGPHGVVAWRRLTLPEKRRAAAESPA